MSDDLAIEVIRLRHRLRKLANHPSPTRDDISFALEEFRAISEHDPELQFEHARWKVQLYRA